MMSVVCTAVSIALACFFFFNDTATTEIYTLSLHDALPIFRQFEFRNLLGRVDELDAAVPAADRPLEGLEVPWRETDQLPERSEEHTSELQSRQYLVCRLLLEKKKKKLGSPTNK